MNERDMPKAYLIDALVASHERTNRRSFIEKMVILAMFIITNLAWTIAYNELLSSYSTDTTVIEAEQDADMFGSNFIINGELDGETTSTDN